MSCSGQVDRSRRLGVRCDRKKNETRYLQHERVGEIRHPRSTGDSLIVMGITRSQHGCRVALRKTCREICTTTDPLNHWRATRHGREWPHAQALPMSVLRCRKQDKIVVETSHGKQTMR